MNFHNEVLRGATFYPVDSTTSSFIHHQRRDSFSMSPLVPAESKNFFESKPTATSYCKRRQKWA